MTGSPLDGDGIGRAPPPGTSPSFLTAALVRAGVRIGAVLVGALLALAGTGFVFAAIYLALADVLPASGAALLTGLIGLAAGAVVVLAARPRRPPRRAAAAAAGPEAAVLGLAAAAGEQAAALARSRSAPLIASALAAGFAVGASPGLRRALLRLLRGPPVP